VAEIGEVFGVSFREIDLIVDERDLGPFHHNPSPSAPIQRALPAVAHDAASMTKRHIRRQSGTNI
jgi:hypothetical protein